MHFSASVIASVALLATAVSSNPIEVRKDHGKAPKFNSNTSTGKEITRLKQKLSAASSFGDRQAILAPNPPDASNYVFQFINNTVTGGTGGTIALSTVNNFPTLIGTEVAMAVGFVNACGLNVPHSHPRGTEYLTVIQGELVAGLVLEINDGSNGNVVGQPPPTRGPIPQVYTKLKQYQGFYFPQGETHWQFNPTCKPALFAAAFDSSDPGRTQIARNFFSNTPDEVLIAAVGGDLELLDGARIEQFQDQIPNDYAVIMKECAVKCGFI